MKIVKFISSLFVLGSASATLEVAIDDHKLEQAAQTIMQESMQLAHDPRVIAYNQAMKNAQLEAGLEVRQSQRAIMKPAIKELKGYVEYFSPSRDCSVNGLAQCLNRFESTGQPMPLGMEQCSTQNNCTVRWDSLSVQKKMKLEQKFGKTSQQLDIAFGALEQKVVLGYQKAIQAQQANLMAINQQWQNTTTQVLKQWGCNSTCVDNNGANFKMIVEECSCPTGIKYNETNEPFAKVSLDYGVMDSDDTELVEKKSDTDANAGIQNGKLSANVNVNGLTTTVVLIFALQLVFCFVICVYTNAQVQSAQTREEKQKADFYSFLYQFHKQMADEEQAMQELYGKQGGGGGTPGADAPQKL